MVDIKRKPNFDSVGGRLQEKGLFWEFIIIRCNASNFNKKKEVRFEET